MRVTSSAAWCSSGGRIVGRRRAEHRLARARRPDEEQVVRCRRRRPRGRGGRTRGRGHRARSSGFVVGRRRPAASGGAGAQSGHDSSPFRHARSSPSERAARTWTSLHERRPRPRSRAARRRPRVPARARASTSASVPGTGPHRAVEAELAEDGDAVERAGGELVGRRRAGRARPRARARSRVLRTPPGARLTVMRCWGHGHARRQQGGTHPLARLAHGGVGQPDDRVARADPDETWTSTVTGWPSTPTRVALRTAASTAHLLVRALRTGEAAPSGRHRDSRTRVRHSSDLACSRVHARPRVGTGRRRGHERGRQLEDRHEDTHGRAERHARPEGRRRDAHGHDVGRGRARSRWRSPTAPSTATTLTWKAALTQPMPITLEFTAKVDGDTISGNVKLGTFGDATFEGTARLTIGGTHRRRHGAVERDRGPRSAAASIRGSMTVDSSGRRTASWRRCRARARTRARRTRTTSASSWRGLQRGELHARPTLDHRTLRRYLAYLDTRGFARSSIARKAAALRSYLRFLQPPRRDRPRPRPRPPRAEGRRRACRASSAADEADDLLDGGSRPRSTPTGGRRRSTRSPSRSCCATSPCSRCSTAPGCASPSAAGCGIADCDLDRGLRHRARQGVQGPAGAARRAGRRRARAPGSRDGRAAARDAPTSPRRRRVPQPARSRAHAA